MKRKFLAVILPLIGCATVVGSGFSAWYFGDDVASSNTSTSTTGVEITSAVNSEDIAFTIGLRKDSDNQAFGSGKTTTLYLDQSGKQNTYPGGENPAYTYNETGLMIANDSGDHNEATNSNLKWQIDATFTGDKPTAVDIDKYKTLNALYDAGYKVQIIFEIHIDDKLDDYIAVRSDEGLVSVGIDNAGITEISSSQFVKVEDAALTSGMGSGGTLYRYIYEPTIDNADVTSRTWKIDVDTTTVDASGESKLGHFNNSLFTWVDGQKPTNFTQYSNMVYALTGSYPESSNNIIALNDIGVGVGAVIRLVDR